jgi:hypothetical protein
MKNRVLESNSRRRKKAKKAPRRQPAIETGHLSMDNLERAVVRVGKLKGRVISEAR